MTGYVVVRDQVVTVANSLSRRRGFGSLALRSHGPGPRQVTQRSPRRSRHPRKHSHSPLPRQRRLRRPPRNWCRTQGRNDAPSRRCTHNHAQRPDEESRGSIVHSRARMWPQTVEVVTTSVDSMTAPLGHDCPHFGPIDLF